MNCNCLCAANHPDDRGIYTGATDKTIRFYSTYTGDVDVDMCEPCATATLATLEASEAPPA